MNGRATTGHVGFVKPTFARVLFALAVAAPVVAHADEAGPVHLVADGVDGAALSASLAVELGRPVTAVAADAPCPSPCVVVHRRGAEATVDVIAADGTLRRRTIGVPDDAAAAVDVIVLLASNLARDEAAAILATLDDAEPVSVPDPAPVADAPPAIAPAPVAASTPAPALVAPERPTAEGAGTSVSFGLLPFVSVSTSSAHARAVAAIDLLAGVRHRMGIGVAGVASVVRHDVRGAQIAGVATVAGDVDGLQLAGVAAAAGDVDGFQIGGVAAAAKGSVDGFQVGGVAAVARGRADGVQIGGVAATSGGRAGVQVGGVATAAGGAVATQIGGVATAARGGAGVQIAGVAAVSGGDTGVQISGVANVTRGRLRGAQIGLVNVAGRSDGMQIGLVNVARGGRGGAFGLVNIVPGGRTELEGTIDQDSLGTVVLRHGGRRFHNVYGLGGRVGKDEVGGELDGEDFLLYGIGFGPTLYAGRTTIDLDLMAWHVMYGDQRPWGDQAPDDLNLLTQARLIVGIPIGPTHVVAGAAVNTFITTDAMRPTIFARTVPGATPPMDTADKVHGVVWPTVFAGVRL